MEDYEILEIDSNNIDEDEDDDDYPGRGFEIFKVIYPTLIFTE